MKIFKDLSYRKIFVFTLLFVPVTIWDVFFFLIEKLYFGCKFIDRKGDEVLSKLTAKYYS